MHAVRLLRPHTRGFTTDAQLSWASTRVCGQTPGCAASTPVCAQTRGCTADTRVYGRHAGVRQTPRCAGEHAGVRATTRLCDSRARFAGRHPGMRIDIRVRTYTDTQLGRTVNPASVPPSLVRRRLGGRVTSTPRRRLGECVTSTPRAGVSAGALPSACCVGVRICRIAGRQSRRTTGSDGDASAPGSTARPVSEPGSGTGPRSRTLHRDRAPARPGSGPW
jgi:hypothetical protein